LHIEFFKGGIYPEILEPNAPYLCLLGDIGVTAHHAYRTFLLEQANKYEKVLVVAGNHGTIFAKFSQTFEEYYRSTIPKSQQTMQNICNEHPNLVLMDKTSITNILLFVD
jgi:hypothetical protein